MNKKNGRTKGTTTQTNTRTQYSKIASLGLNGQAHHITFFILENPCALTHHIAHRCAVGNVSHAAKKANARLGKVGLRLICTEPHPRIINRFGVPSPVHQWELVEIGGADEQ